MFLRRIKDIRISKKEISIIRDADINVKELEVQIQNLSFSGFDLIKVEKIESLELPPFIQAFYYLFFKDLRIPSEAIFYDTYIEWLGVQDVSKKFSELELLGIQARLKRTYPSLIRDIHFLYLLETSGIFDEVEYSMERDYYNGLDLKVIYKAKVFFVSIFIDTSRGRYFKSKKLSRHDYSNIEELVFNVNFSDLRKLGNIYLLTNKHVLLLETMINQKQF